MRLSTLPHRGDHRREEIVALLCNSTDVTVGDLARYFAVTPMTIRRDLQALEAQGLVRRVHGGVVLAARDTRAPLPGRGAEVVPAERAIAEAATTLIGTGEAVIVDAGSTTVELARVVRNRSSATVVTPSPHVAAELSNPPHVRVVLTGGRLRPHELDLVGFSTAVVSVAGLDVERGITADDPDNARVKRAAIGATDRRIVLADATRCGHVAPVTVAPLAIIDVLVTDAEPGHPVVRELDANGTEVIHVRASGPAGQRDAGPGGVVEHVVDEHDGAVGCFEQ